MKFIFTGKKWVNGDMIKDVGLYRDIYKKVKSADKETLEEAKKKGLRIGNTSDPEVYHVESWAVMITEGNGEWVEYDPLTELKTREEAEDTAIKLIQELEGIYSGKCEEEAKKTHEQAGIEELELPSRAFHIFRRRGMLTVGDVLEVIRKGKLKEFRGIGQTTEQEILEKVHLFMEARQ